jgi:hypothetical protein
MARTIEVKTTIIILLVQFLFGNGNPYFQQMVKYEIDVTLNDSAHTLSAYMKLEYTNNSPDTLEFIWFHLWPNAYKNDSTAFAKQQIKNGSRRFADSDEKDRGFIDSLVFIVDGVKATWETHTDWIDVAKIMLPNHLLPGMSVIIETPFIVKLPLVFSRLGHSGKHYEITQWYPKPAVYDHKGWHQMPYLNMGEFYSEFGIFDVKITLPKDYRLMATGDLVNGKDELYWLDSLAAEGDSLHAMPKKELKKKLKLMKKNAEKSERVDSSYIEMKTLHFHQENVHDFAWFADKNWIVRKGELLLSDSTRNITLWSFYLPKNATLWENSIEYLHDSGYWYSKFYGDYPYNHLTAVDGDLSAGGGMEYPNITVISTAGSKDLLEYVIMHEVGHNWFYGILGSNERDHTWMDEGLNEYSNIRYWQKKYKGRNEQIIISEFVQNKLGIAKNLSMSWFTYAGYVNSGKSKDAQPLNLTAEKYIVNNYWQHYSKTAVFMRYLHHYLGEEKMDEIFQDFYLQWEFRHPYPEDLETVFAAHLEDDLDWFFDNVFEKTTYVDYGIVKTGDQFILHNYGTFTCPVEVAFYNGSGQEIQRDWYHKIDNKKILSVPSGVISARIDPDLHMPDVNRSNNGTQKGFKINFVWDQPTYFYHDVNIVPWFFSYNYYNGFTPGLTIFSGFAPGYDGSGNALSFLYDFNHQKPVGSFSITRPIRSINFFHISSLNINMDHGSGRTGFNAKISGTIKEPYVKSPVAKINANLFYHYLDSTAFDSFLYDGGKFLTTSIRYTKDWELNIDSELTFQMGIKIGKYFSRSFLSSHIGHRFTKNIATKIRLFASGFLFTRDLPAQYRTYLSGSIDPDFENNILDRTGKSEATQVLSHIFYDNGPGLRGLVLDGKSRPLATEKMAWSLRINQELPYIPGYIFFDIGGITEEKNSFIVSGLQFGPFLLPFYQSWESEHEFPNNGRWVLDRLRLNFNVSLPFGFNI